MPEPAFRQFVLKVHSRCNLACNYCYVYESVDQSWRLRPLTIKTDTVRLIGQRIAEHAVRHSVPRVHVTLHGGEALMVGLDGLRRVVDTLREAVGDSAELGLGLQTNGVLLDERVARYALDEDIRVGISLDGGRQANDRHRRYAHGGSSYDQVVQAVRLMASSEFRRIFVGILATVDPFNDPVVLFRDLQDLRPGLIDLLLPHATWEKPPPAALPGRTVYGDWLVRFFDVWYVAPPVIGVRLFQEIMHVLLGGASTAEAVGLSSPESIVIETDGSYERTDTLKVTFPGAPATGLTVAEHALEDVLRHPAVVAMVGGRQSLCRACRECPVVAACGGGLYPHRYSSARGFDNPSVYCQDIGRLVNRISQRLDHDLAVQRLGVVTDGPAP